MDAKITVSATERTQGEIAGHRFHVFGILDKTRHANAKTDPTIACEIAMTKAKRTIEQNLSERMIARKGIDICFGNPYKRCLGFSRNANASTC